MKFYLSLLIIFYSLFSFSQENNEADTFIIIKGDSIMKNSIELNEISLLPRIKFNDRDKLRQYLILKRKTLKVYPYAKLASVRLESLYERVNGIKRKRNRKRYIKRTQKYIEGKFTDELKKLTRVIWGSGIGGIETFQNEVIDFALGDGTPRFNPFFIPKMIGDIAPHLSQ